MNTIMKATHKLTGLLAVLVMLGLTACDNNVSNDDQINDLEVAELSALITTELSLSSAQQADLNNVLVSNEGRTHEPGFLWTLAAELQATLTDEQKEELFALTEEMEGGTRFRGLGGFQGPGDFQGVGGFQGPVEGAPGVGRPPHPGFGGPGGFSGINGPRQGVPRPGGMHGPHDGGALEEILTLTDEQKASIDTIHENYREQFDALIESKRDDEITHEAFKAEASALHEAKRAEIEGVLTAEQLAELEAYLEEKKAEMEAEMAERQAAHEEHMILVREARNVALGLSDEQVAALDAFEADQKAAREALIEQFRNEDITFEELGVEMDALAAAEDEFLVDNLNATQLEIVEIHDALSVRARRIAKGPKGRGKGGIGSENGFGQGRGGFPGVRG